MWYYIIYCYKVLILNIYSIIRHVELPEPKTPDENPHPLFELKGLNTISKQKRLNIFI